MIGKLKGILEEKSKEGVVIDVGGVGYELHVPELALLNLPEPGQSATFFVYTHVREDQISLFGFADALGKDVFKILLGASGIGPKLALAILSALEPRQVLDGLARGDKALFNGISGVGKKTVEKLILEMREKAEKRLLLERGAADLGGRSKSRPDIITGPSSWTSDLEQALLAMGYRENDVRAVVRQTLNGEMEFKTFEEAFKHALKLHSSAVAGSKGMRGFA